MKTPSTSAVVDGPCHKKQKIKAEGEENSQQIPNDKLGGSSNHITKVAGFLGYWFMKEIYNSSKKKLKIPRISLDELVYFSQLAISTYNIQEDTNFDRVELLRAKRSCVTVPSHFWITFKAFNPHGVATTFQTKLDYYISNPCMKVDIIFVRIKPDPHSNSDSDEDFADPSKVPRYIAQEKDKICKQRYHQLIKTQTNDSGFKLPIYLSQFALVTYNTMDLRLYHAAKHDIPSLKIVKPMEHDGKRITYRTTYPITFEAPLCDDSKNVETFQTEIGIPTFFPTTTIECWDFMIMPNC